jgi:hypothetical protein
MIKINLQKPIAFFPQLAKALGGIEEAIYIQQLYYWSDKGKRGDGYIYKSKKEWEEETTLSRYQQDRIRKKLKEQGIIETKLIKANGSPTIHYKIIEGGVRTLLMDKQETYYSNGKKLTKPLTENTTENTTNYSSNEEKVFSYKEKLEGLRTSKRIDKTEWKYPPQANIAVGKKQHSPQANNDTHRRQPLPNKETNKKETNNNINSSNEEKEFSLKKELESLRANSKRKDYKIIADYIEKKGFVFDNKEQYLPVFKRCLASAKYLKGYNQAQIQETIEYCISNYPEIWTLETVLKRIPDVINKK